MGKLEHPHPTGLMQNPAYSHVVVASGTRTIYIAGQVALDERGAIVGAGDRSTLGDDLFVKRALPRFQAIQLLAVSRRSGQVQSSVLILTIVSARSLLREYRANRSRDRLYCIA
mgnify:CR=1 FL=1